MSAHNKKVGITLVVIVGLGLFVYWLRQPSGNDSLPAKGASPVSPSKEAEPVRQVRVEAVSKQKLANMERRKNFLRMQSVGFTSLGISDKNPFLKFKTQVLERRCRGGDLDIIEHDLLLAGQSEQNLVFTIESLSSESGALPPQMLTSSLSQLMSGAAGQFKLSPGNKPHIYGLFLCSFKGDIKQEKKICSDLKPQQTISDLMLMQKEALTSPAKRLKYPDNAKIYFLQILVVGPMGVHIYENRRFFQAAGSLMNAALQTDKYPYLEADIDRAMSLVRSIDSMSPLVMNNEVTLNLPHRGDCPYVDRDRSGIR
jgi:hypothetical protein